MFLSRSAHALPNLQPDCLLRPRHGGCSDGFTLIEVVVVLVILGLMLTLVAPTIGTGTPKAENGVVALVRSARAASIARGEVMRLDVEASGDWRLSGLGGSGDDPVAAGHLAPQGAAFGLIFSPLGICAPAIGTTAAQSLPLDPLDCELRTP